MRIVSSSQATFVGVIVGILSILSTFSRVRGNSGEDVRTFASLSDFKSTVIDSDSVWLIEFYDDPADLSLVYKEVATVLRGIVNVGAVDVTQSAQREIADSLGLDKFPKIFALGHDKMKPVEHTAKVDPQELLQTAISMVGKVVETRGRERWLVQGEQPGGGSSSGSSGSSSSSRGSNQGPKSSVVTLTERNFQRKVLDNPEVGMVAFIAPWCGHCKALLPEWAEASRLLEGEGVYLGVVDATVESNLANQYGVQGYPTIKIFPGGKNKSATDAISYEGGRTKEDIVRAALAEVDNSGIPKPIPEFVGPDSVKQCEGTNKICLLVALPHIAECSAEKRNKYIETLTAVGKKFRGAAFQIQWFEGGSQPDLEENLDFTFGYPAVAAVSLDKGVYATMHGSFSEKSISLFLTGITTGRQTTNPFRKELTVVSVEPWDGKDAQPPEEEFSLEDIMGDDDELTAEL